ncbi:DUF2538 family protein [Paenibacillus pasadenensis]|uniref:DUF2538 family protein n=1 Tax=Paenibacillus pasadenensis TaxID=217090 RepID=UPI00041F8167|nr:DUF2538 family protein [Paenibacillus pasadenensis]
MYFTNATHEQNYEALRQRFGIDRNEEYLVAAYISALPEIFYKVNWDGLEGPLSWFWKWNEDLEKHELSRVAGTLSSSYLQIGRAAAEMYTGNYWEFDLVGFLSNAGDELYRTFVQALEIRRGRSILNLD